MDTSISELLYLWQEQNEVRDSGCTCRILSFKRQKTWQNVNINKISMVDDLSICCIIIFNISQFLKF